MVGIVIISHSHELSSGAQAMALQMCQDRDVVVTAAGGLEDGSLGTSFDKIEAALNQAYSDDGVLILMDLGSAVMTTQMVVEMLAPEQQEHVRLSNAPLVEGAIAAAAAAAIGQGIDDVQHAAENALNEVPKVVPDGSEKNHIYDQQNLELENPGQRLSVEIIVPNPIGLHARPAMQFVKTASQFRALITLQNISQNRDPVDGKMPMQVAFGGTARQGEKIRIEAVGEDAENALASLKTLVESGFGEMDESLTLLRVADPPKPKKTDVPEGPPPKSVQGIGVSEGYAVAPAHVFLPDTLVSRPLPEQEPASPDEEVARLLNAIKDAKRQLKRLEARVAAELDEKEGRIFEFQRMLLEDSQFVNDMETEIHTNKCTAESSVRTVFTGWIDRAVGLDETMQARAVDLHDVENRLLMILGGSKEKDRFRFKHPAILVAADLTPSDTARMDRSLVRGIATAVGGTTSHTAILARTWGIPAVMGLGEAILSVAENTQLALDGTTGLVEIDPSEETAATYSRRADQFYEFQNQAIAKASEPALTKDGKRVEVFANVAGPDSVEEALRLGAEGIGLLRTEFLFLNRSTAPDENEQYEAYRKMVVLMGQKPVVMRTLDVGGDKQLPFIDIGPELNPFLGVRAIRLCLKRPDIFQPQLRAMLRAAAGGNVKIMFPMITTLKEVYQAKAALSEARDALSFEGVEYATDIEVGIMIETPAAAINADSLAREVDFLSIGSNDLTQYTLACDRGNRNMDDLFETWNPAVLRLIKHVIEQAHAAGKWVGLCGEFAGERESIPFLIGLGLNEFSVAGPRLPAVKQWIRQLDSAACKAKAEKILKNEPYKRDPAEHP